MLLQPLKMRESQALPDLRDLHLDCLCRQNCPPRHQPHDLASTSASTSIADLHYIIQIAMGWDNEYLHCFHIYGKDYGIAYEGGMSFSDNPRHVKLDNFTFDIGDRFTYRYNFYDHWLCDIRIEDIQLNDESITPFCTGGQ